MRKHFHQHPLIPFASGVYHSSDEIYKDALIDVLNFCAEHNAEFLFVYLWISWYQPDRWSLWARSVDDEIPFFRTNNFCEGHFRLFKRDFLAIDDLSKCAKQRIDFLLYIISTRIVPHFELKLKQVTSRRVKPARWKAFQHSWKELSTADFSGTVYETNSEKWICSCESFLYSRFMMCKHLVQPCRLPNGIAHSRILRSRKYPFLTVANTLDTDSTSSFASMPGNELISAPPVLDNTDVNLESAVGFMEEDGPEEDPTIHEASQVKGKINKLRDLLNWLEQHGEEQANNLHQLRQLGKAIDKSTAVVERFKSDIEVARNRRTLPRTSLCCLF